MQTLETKNAIGRNTTFYVGQKVCTESGYATILEIYDDGRFRLDDYGSPAWAWEMMPA